MEQIKKVLNEVTEIQSFSKIIISNPANKTIKYKKIVVEPKQSKKVFYQLSMFYETKVKHENIESNISLVDRIMEICGDYRQIDIFSDINYKILISKNKNCTIIKEKSNCNESKQSAQNNISSHNRQKNYILQEGTYIPWLHSLGIMNSEGKVLANYQKKFRQLNKFLEMVCDVIEHIPYGANIVDVGCGKSYLTFALYYLLNVINDKNVTITGLDLKHDVVEKCQALADDFKFDRLSFICRDISEYKTDEAISMVITLHACDTATDYALYNAIKWNCKLIMSVPCCQHELFSQIKNDSFNALLKHGILKERFSALYTDALRASLLEVCGYKTNVVEFIDMEHTPKNIMIRAVKKRNGINSIESFLEFKNMFGASPKLYELLGDYIEK